MKKLAVLVLLLFVSPVFAAPNGAAVIVPKYVDTSVINQTFVYTVTPDNETINRIVLNSTGANGIVRVVDVTLNGTSCIISSCSGGNVTAEPNQINVTFTSPVLGATVVNITFTANTTSLFNVSNFTAYVNNSNGIGLTSSSNSTIVTTQQMVNVTALTMTKGVAIINGSDYWEFKFDLGLAASQAGVIQFKMNDWIEVSGLRIPVNTSSVYYATLRHTNSNLTTFDNATNITTSYAGALNKTSASSESYYLRMIIPLGTPTSNSWSTSYNFLFRATP